MATPVAVTTSQIQAAQGGDQTAMWEIIDAFEPMIRHAIRTVAPAAQDEDAEDLLQEGRIVLIQHIRQYDTEASSASLSSYAYRALNRAIAEEWVRMSNAFKVDPTKVIRVRRALWEAEGKVEDAWKIVSEKADPTHRMSREAFVSVCEALMGVDSLEGPDHSGGWSGEGVRGGGATLADTIPDSSADFTDQAERKALAHYLLGEIPQRQAYALRAFYGIGMPETPDHDTAADLGIRVPNLRQLRSEGKRSCRTVAHSHGLAA
ncbi:sigma-70 family RNA polymerase sigma factor [Streptomyces californicus]|uniref:sigma-70 family RNA polymerase sigma factor n=1 Tax=Streptomyces californicus TaxID=67351 RepID=UPI0004C29084|nr:sigma-70 family RNA polymerase sigma factor [Streptomyces californicus]QRV53459.1 sigma-70 family RNA polymerase sigma factor [Streptomyces californicus]